MIYLAKCNEFYKIGFAHNPKRRLPEMQTGNPVEIELVGFWDGGMRDEQKLHEMFAERRVRGEWFLLTDEDLTILERIRAEKSPPPREIREPIPIPDGGCNWCAEDLFFTGDKVVCANGCERGLTGHRPSVQRAVDKMVAWMMRKRETYD